MPVTKRNFESVARIAMLVVFVVYSVVPAGVQARELNNSINEATSAESVERSLPEQASVFYQPPQTGQPQDTSPEGDEVPSRVPEKDPVEFIISTSKGEVGSSRNVGIDVIIRNHSVFPIEDLTYYDKLEDGLKFGTTADPSVKYNPVTQTITYKIDAVNPGDEIAFSYTIKATDTKSGKLSIHNAEIEYDLGVETLAQTATLGFADNSPLVKADALIVVPDKAGDGWESADRYSVYLGDEVLSRDVVVSIAPADISENGPALQFELQLIQTAAPATTLGGELQEQDINLTRSLDTKFDSPAYLEIQLDGYADLSDPVAGKEPYVVTYDEASSVWVKVPILETDPEANTVTVEAAHFSTWGAGLGNSLPQNGANILLFDQPYTSLFTGSSRYSIPIWTPPGRAGVSPDISLAYSSGTLDGVLGDVQASWVGSGWNIDGIEVVRKIVTNENGYGYNNSFALTLNGTVYELLVDPNQPNRYYTKQGSFLYIERHNYALGNEKTDGNVAPPNKAGEWWEAVTTDGTRYRLGWNIDSEQLALMYGYSCTTGNPCTTPDGAYASLGYAGRANDLVALRWRVDRITDVHGNYIIYSYTETQPSGPTTLAAFDRESYLSTISYTGFENPEGGSGNLNPAYQVKFETANRLSIGDVPTTFNIWDNLDSKYLDKILICYSACDQQSQIIRTYDLGYSLAAVPNANGTLTLTSIEVSGGGFTESGQIVPETNAPTIRFTYQNLDNRAVTGGSDKYTYPRLNAINNGTGGNLTYTYETDGRGTDSWYNYRVKEVRLESGSNTAAYQSYTYTTPVYTGQGGNPNLGGLIGYTTSSEKQVDYNNGNAILLETKHTFGTVGLDIGYELQTEWLSGTTVLKKTTNTYVSDNSKAPFTGWNYRYLYQTVNYVRNAGSLIVASKVVYSRDPATGNLLLQTDYLGTASYRKTYYEYLTNPDPSVYILDKASRVLVTTASNAILSDARYHYDDHINTPPTQGDLTLTQSFTGSGNQTVDSAATYDIYGNVLTGLQYTSYGTVNVQPTGNAQVTTTVYDSTLKTFPVTQTNTLNQTVSTEYLYRLAAPYQVTDANGWSTSTTYDGLGRKLSITVPGLEQEAVWYTYPAPNGSGNIQAPYAVEMQILDKTADVYRSVWGIYDGLGRQAQMQVHDSDLNKILVTDTFFNAQGLASRQSAPYYVSAYGGYYVSPNGIQFTDTLYDVLGRTTQVKQPGNLITNISYDGLSTTTEDPNGNKIERATDGLGRLVYVREYSNSGAALYSTTRYTNDALNRLTNVTDAYSNLTTLQYDWLGRKTGMDDPDMGVWTYAYNPMGGLTQQTDARNETLTFTYDALNRLLTKSGTNVNTSYTYGTAQGSIGMRISMSDAVGTTTWAYDNYGRTVTENRGIGGQTKTLTTTSDWLGRPLIVEYPDSETLTYTYDALGRPEALDSDLEAGLLVNLAYNVLGQITTQALGNGVTITNTYESATNRLDTRAATNGLIDFDYTYDNAGNITQITDGALGETHTYQYDFLNRLTSAEAVVGANYAYRQQFSYDHVGNITQMNEWITPAPTSTPTITLTPSATATATETATATATATQLGFDPGSVAAMVPVSYNNSSNAAMFHMAEPARFDLDTDTPTATSTDTSTPTATDTPTDTATITNTPTNTRTPTRTPVPTNTAGPSPTASNTPTITSTPTPTLWNDVDAYTSAFLHMNGVDASTTFTDETGKIWTVNGNAQIDTAQFRFEGASGLFDGSGDFLEASDNGAFDFGTGDFTIDLWCRFNGSGDFSFVSGRGPTNGDWMLARLADNTLRFGRNIIAWDSTSPAQTWTNGVWYHIAVVRSNGTLYMFKDGVQIFSGANTNSYNISNSTIIIGGRQAAPGSNAVGLYFNGHLDELRISKGIARWTANFMPPGVTYTPTNTTTSTITYTPSKTPTASRTPTPYTLTPTSSHTPTPTPQLGSLIAYWSFDNVAGTTVPDDATGDVTANNATLTNGPVVETSGASGSSVYFDGTNDYASVADQAEIKNNGSFTISAWINPASIVTSRTQYIVQKGGTNKDYGLITVSTQGTATPTANPGNTNLNGSIAFQVGDLTPNTLFGPILPVNTWTLVTGVYDASANQTRLYLNGELIGAQNVTGTVSMSTTGLTFSSSSTANVYHGRLDEVRFYNRALTGSEVLTVLGAFPTPTPLSVTATPTVITATPNITPIPLSQQPWGTGNDGDLTVSSGNTFNLNTQNSGSRSCSDGGDAVAYSVTSLADNFATLNASPSSGCLSAGDEVMLINLQGTTTSNDKVGLYEFLRVSSVSGATVNFTTTKTKWYGEGWRSDSNIGTSTGQQHVMVIRVPNYEDLTVNGTMTGSAWSGTKNGVVVFRVKQALTGSGTIHANGLGYSGGTGSYGDNYAASQTINYGGGAPGGNADPGFGRYGGGGGYGTTGGQQSGNGQGAGGLPYGSAQLNPIYFGGAGGAGGETNGTPDIPGEPGGRGGGILLVIAHTINYSGNIQSNGAAGGERAGGGAGGSVRIESYTITGINSINASGNGLGGVGRIAVYYQNSMASVTSSPGAYVGVLGLAPTPTVTPTPADISGAVSYGTGADGDLTVSSGNTFNLSTQYSGSRTCADGIAYAVSSLTENSATLTSSPTAACLKPGDEILLFNARGSTSGASNAGRFEFLRVGAINGTAVYFTTPKNNYYGQNTTDDSTIGTGSGQQRVMIVRVPNYDDVTINGTLTTAAWDGTKFGVVVFRVKGTLSGSGTVHSNALGFGPAGYGDNYAASQTINYGGGAPGGSANPGFGRYGGGGGHATNGGKVGGNGHGAGGLSYGNAPLDPIYFGAAGGNGGEINGEEEPPNRDGGRGGGIVLILADTIDFDGSIQSKGGAGGEQAGGGAGGSIRIEGNTVTMNTIDISGNGSGGGGGSGRSAVYYVNSFSANFTPGYLAQVNPNASATPTATVPSPTQTLTPTAAPTGWIENEYTYSSTIPHAVIAVSSTLIANSYVYDANGNMTCRAENGEWFIQAYNTENRVSSIVKLASGDCTMPGNYASKWDFTYDGDGTRAATLTTPYISGVPQTAVLTAYYFGGAYEVTGSDVRKYYSFGGQSILRDSTGLQYFLSDHLGSVVGITDDEGTLISEQRYLPFGAERTDVGAIAQTDYGYTGQRDNSYIKLMDYDFRWFSPELGRFISPDSIVPNPANPQSLNRYAYVLNNPIRYNDPTGHMMSCGRSAEGCGEIISSAPICLSSICKPDRQRTNRSLDLDIGVFTEEQLNNFGIYCGDNVKQVACDVYTKGNKIEMASLGVDFKGNPFYGNSIANFSCWSVRQGCINEGNSYSATFIYRGSFMNDGVSWNRYATNSANGETSPLFTANWSVAQYRGATVARETFPLRSGSLGYASVYLQPHAENGSIIWQSIGVEYGPNARLGLGVYLPEPFIVFRTSQSQGDLANFFYTEGTFSLAGETLGTISIGGYITP